MKKKKEEEEAAAAAATAAGPQKATAADRGRGFQQVSAAVSQRCGWKRETKHGVAPKADWLFVWG